jgi:hypothetical protein
VPTTDERLTTLEVVLARAVDDLAIGSLGKDAVRSQAEDARYATELAALRAAVEALSIVLPSVVGQQYRDGRFYLQQRGFVVARSDVPAGGTPVDQIISQSPTAGSTVGYGDTVTLTVAT